MNDGELREKVYSAAYNLLNSKGFISPVDILLFAGILSNKDYDDWRFGCVFRVKLTRDVGVN